MWKHWSIPILFWPGSSWFLLFPLTEFSAEGTVLLWCCWHYEKCDGRPEKAFTKWLPGMFPTSLQSLAEVFSCTRGLLWNICSLNDCIVLYFSEIKWFQGHSKATTYMNIRYWTSGISHLHAVSNLDYVLLYSIITVCNHNFYTKPSVKWHRPTV
jgi:hypothetical protein